MNQTPRQIVRPGFVLALLIVFGLFFIIASLLPSFGGSRKAKLPQVLNNLRQIEIVKEIWASEHAASNGAAVSDSELAAYLNPRQGSTGLVASVAGEVYRANAIGTPAEARLERPIGTRFPMGTLVRWSTNVGCEILLPNQQSGANGWQPLYSGTNRISRAAGSRRSP